MHENYKVSGMYCAACSSAVEKAVAKIDGEIGRASCRERV